MGTLPDVFLGHQSRFNRVQPSMSSRANLAVFLYELRDIKRMFELIPPKHLRTTKGKKILRNWREVLHYLNNQHLNWSFGWRPFLRDLNMVFAGLYTFEDRLKKFITNENQQLRLRSSDTGEAEESIERSGGGWTATIEYSYNTLWRSLFGLTYTLPKYSERELRTRAYLDTLGLRVTPANIWAVIPWSFVIDWFAGIGNFLDKYSQDWLSPYIEMNRSLATVKHEGNADVFLQYTARIGNPRQLVGTLNFDAFHRRSGLPRNEVLWSTLDSNKIRLGASLVGSRLR